VVRADRSGAEWVGLAAKTRAARTAKRFYPWVLFVYSDGKSIHQARESVCGVNPPIVSVVPYSLVPRSWFPYIVATSKSATEKVSASYHHLSAHEDGGKSSSCPDRSVIGIAPERIVA
jgi:hypothetical protein